MLSRLAPVDPSIHRSFPSPWILLAGRSNGSAVELTHISNINVERLLAQVLLEGGIDALNVVLDQERELLQVVQAILDGQRLERVERRVQAVVGLGLLAEVLARWASKRCLW